MIFGIIIFGIMIFGNDFFEGQQANSFSLFISLTGFVSFK